MTREFNRSMVHYFPLFFLMALVTVRIMVPNETPTHEGFLQNSSRENTFESNNSPKDTQFSNYSINITEAQSQIDQSCVVLIITYNISVEESSIYLCYVNDSLVDFGVVDPSLKNYTSIIPINHNGLYFIRLVIKNQDNTILLDDSQELHVTSLVEEDNTHNQLWERFQENGLWIVVIVSVGVVLVILLRFTYRKKKIIVLGYQDFQGTNSLQGVKKSYFNEIITSTSENEEVIKSFLLNCSNIVEIQVILHKSRQQIYKVTPKQDVLSFYKKSHLSHVNKELCKRDSQGRIVLSENINCTNISFEKIEKPHYTIIVCLLTQDDQNSFPESTQFLTAMKKFSNKFLEVISSPKKIQSDLIQQLTNYFNIIIAFPFFPNPQVSSQDRPHQIQDQILKENVNLLNQASQTQEKEIENDLLSLSISNILGLKKSITTKITEETLEQFDSNSDTDFFQLFHKEL